MPINTPINRIVLIKCTCAGYLSKKKIPHINIEIKKKSATEQIYNRCFDPEHVMKIATDPVAVF